MNPLPYNYYNQKQYHKQDAEYDGKCEPRLFLTAQIVNVVQFVDLKFQVLCRLFNFEIQILYDGQVGAKAQHTQDRQYCQINHWFYNESEHKHPDERDERAQSQSGQYQPEGLAQILEGHLNKLFQIQYLSKVAHWLFDALVGEIDHAVGGGHLDRDCCVGARIGGVYDKCGVGRKYVGYEGWYAAAEHRLTPQNVCGTRGAVVVAILSYLVQLAGYFLVAIRLGTLVNADLLCRTAAQCRGQRGASGYVKKK